MSDSLQSLFSRCDSVLVFDTETSGLSWQRDEIIEFSAIRLTASGTEEVDEFIRCTRSLPPRIVELTGITDELLREEGIGKQAFAELLAALLTPGTMLAAYNAQFDLLFLYSFLQKYGDARLLQDKPKLDLLTVYRDRRAYPHRLCNAIEQYDLQARISPAAAPPSPCRRRPGLSRLGSTPASSPAHSGPPCRSGSGGRTAARRVRSTRRPPC